MYKNDVKLFTVQTISSKDYEVKGNVVQSKNVVRDMMASFKTIIGGEIKSYTDMLNEAREKATDRMIEEATTLGLMLLLLLIILHHL